MSSIPTTNPASYSFGRRALGWYVEVAIVGNLKQNVGDTLGDWVKSLDDQAVYLSRQGSNVTDVSELWSFTVQQAAGLGLLPVLDNAVDASVPTSGLSLSLTRSFLNTIPGRYHTGIFGNGWVSNWEMRLSVGSDGAVSIDPGNGSPATYDPDTRITGGYLSASGDTSKLVGLSSGEFDLHGADGTVTHFAANGQVEYIQDANGNRITAGYNASGQLVSLTASSGQSLTLAYNAAGLIASVTDSFGRQTTYAYDAANQHLLSVTTPTGTTQYTYNPDNGTATGNALTSVAFPGGTHEYYSYDASGHLAGTSLDGGANPVIYTYNLGEVTATDALGDSTSTFLNQFGSVSKFQDALGNITTYSYDPSTSQVSKITDPTGQTQTFKYGSHANLISSTDQLGHTTTYTYGLDDRLTSVTDTNGNKTKYGYDASGNLLSSTLPDHTQETNTFNPLGQPISFVNRNGQTIGYTYNANGQLTQESFSDGSSYVYTYDSHSNLTSAVDATGTTAFTYNAEDQLVRIDYPGGQWLQFTYDDAGRRASSLDQLGHRQDYHYNAIGLLESLTDETGQEIVHYSYDAVGRLSRKDFANGVYTTYAYDANSNVLHLIDYAPDGSVSSRFDYAYNALGLETSEATLDGTWTYAYDSSGELVHAAFASVNPAVSNQDLIYNYDALGNRISTVINGVTTVYTVNNLNQYTDVGGTPYTYDADGNLLSDGVNTYAYNELNQLISVTGPDGTTTYAYNAVGWRVSATHNGVTTYFVTDPIQIGNLAGEYDAAGDLIAYYNQGLYGLCPIRRTDAQGNSGYYAFDKIGNVVNVTNASGAVLNRYAYDPFGIVLQANETTSNPLQFIGQYGVTAEVNGLSFMRARFYDAQTARFLSRDPLGIAGSGDNLYRYGNNNPVSRNDPLGLDCSTTPPPGNPRDFWNDTWFASTFPLEMGEGMLLLLEAPAIVAAGPWAAWRRRRRSWRRNMMSTWSASCLATESSVKVKRVSRSMTFVALSVSQARSRISQPMMQPGWQDSQPLWPLRALRPVAAGPALAAAPVASLCHIFRPSRRKTSRSPRPKTPTTFEVPADTAAQISWRPTPCCHTASTLRMSQPPLPRLRPSLSPTNSPATWIGPPSSSPISDGAAR